MAQDPLVGKVLADRFEILERIGEGGTGVVYKAKQITVDREVAIKVLGAHVSTDPQWVKRFHNEARAAAKLDHPNTVRVIDFGQTKEGLLFIAMELLHGRSVRDEIDKVGKLPPARALRIVAQGAASVHEAHTQGIIHRDIKPDNLFLIDQKGNQDFVKVLDFSVAKLDDPNSQQTRAGVVFGTPQYMSPEQGRGAQLGPQSDIYGFGIVLYEALSGKPPFDSKIPTEVVMMHLRDKPKPLDGVPDVVSRLVMKALDKNPANRQKSCEQLAEECEAALAAIGAPAAGGYRTGSQAAVGYGGTGAIPAAPLASPSNPMGGYGGAGPGGAQAAGGVPVAAAADQKTMMPSPEMAAAVQAQVAAARAQGRGGVSVSGADSGQSSGMSGGAYAPPPSSWGPPGGPGGASGGASTVGGGAGPGGTMILPDSQGVIAFAIQQANQAREAAAAAVAPPPPQAKPAGPLFWAAWAVLGVGLGIAIHFAIVMAHAPTPPTS